MKNVQNQLARATEVTPELAEGIRDLCNSHQIDDVQRLAMIAVNEATANLIVAIVTFAPPSADRSTAIRDARNARMWANIAVANKED